MTENTADVSKKTRNLQASFLQRCCTSMQPLEDAMSDFGITHKSLALWLTDADFRKKLSHARRYLRHMRDIQLEMGARHAAEFLTRCTTDTADKDTKLLQERAAVDIIRLSRDSRARAAAMHPDQDDVSKNAAIYHPGVPSEEAKELMAALLGEEAMPKATPSPSYPGERAGVRG
jgi:hypothetical protein